ncbi:4'-phosphopantetheinyl transferase superfamily protein [Streptacidiphilus sp. NEAU-YB345]|uniref:4'-phosphopantetheinyl transferase superfamily protein n=1 Tax=Streptacidiphilus fuscans TaxID=2789292 RepID=A0A931BBP9_9ACTN|nr:4'-phosphopantetheinyl transferase superfamily protein [Streptacidiphilus fuscans]
MVGRTDEILDALPVAATDQEAASARPPWRAAEHAASRTLLRALLREAGADLAAGPIAARPTGRPYLPDRPELGVSLSHSSGWVAAAVGTHCDVGIDVQLPSRVGDRMLRLCCSAEDAEALAAMPEDRRRREFAWIFSVQEACVKAVGQGFRGRPWNVPVALGQQAGEWEREPERVRWRAPRGRHPLPLSLAWTEHPVRDGGCSD